MFLDFSGKKYVNNIWIHIRCPKVSKLDWTCLETPTILAFYCLADLKLTYKLLAQQCWVLLESSRQARFHGIRHRLESCEH